MQTPLYRKFNLRVEIKYRMIIYIFAFHEGEYLILFDCILARVHLNVVDQSEYQLGLFFSSFSWYQSHLH